LGNLAIATIETSETSETSETLLSLLERSFGFACFRANQEAVCRAAIDGKDVLLVMPTGAGKSLCYQLPGLARGGTTLVISPLIALMEDQAAKLTALGFRVARIHSGLDRAESRQACIDYLNGSLQFLFIAPERMRVPGFPEMLAKRKPSLIAIDEAHCISQWGHDFRPDYRMLGEHLPSLRPAPIIALTATATPIVQDDIAQQLKLASTARFIHGFRRENLGIEVVEVAKGMRAQLTAELLEDAERRPAIVYAPTRKEAESLARELNEHFPAAAYHAGLEPKVRESVQRQFLEGGLDAVVATIAFGMGIDKADVRTVIHTALPASLEAYYQEIGRAGRDGDPSRTILMHAYSDRRTHDYFFERDYPDAEELAKIHKALTDEPREIEQLRGKLRMEEQLFDKSLERLTAAGGAAPTFSGDAVRGDNAHWRKLYGEQSRRRGQQLELMMQYVGASQCRMAALVRHFGDVEDAHQPCGQCDFCAPQRCVAQKFRAASVDDQRHTRAVLEALGNGISQSTGKLYKQIFTRAEVGRTAFEDMLGALARAGMVEIEETSFEKDGREIPFRRVQLTLRGENAANDDDEDGFEHAISGLRLKSERSAPAGKRKRTLVRDAYRAPEPAEKIVPRKAPAELPLTAAGEACMERLRVWRLAESKRLGLPPFFIFGDKTMRAIAMERPRGLSELLTVPGIGSAKAEKFGEAIVAICGDD
jgi:RecQ family ATP-dependent DNA helicase